MATVVLVAPEAGDVVRHFLHAEHVEVGEGPGFAHDAREIDASIEAAAPLDIPGDELHRNCGKDTRNVRGASAAAGAPYPITKSDAPLFRGRVVAALFEFPDEVVPEHEAQYRRPPTRRLCGTSHFRRPASLHP